MRKLILFIALTGCAYGQINEYYDLKVKQAEKELADFIAITESDAEKLRVDETAPTVLCDKEIRKLAKKCWSTKGDYGCKEADKIIREKLSHLKFASYNASSEFCNSDEKIKAVNSRIKYEINCKPKLEIDSLMYCLEQATRENHNLQLQKTKEKFIADAKEYTANKIVDLQYYRSRDIADEGARVSAALNGMANNLNHMNTQNKLNQINLQNQQILYNQQTGR